MNKIIRTPFFFFKKKKRSVALGTPAENCLREQFALERQDTAKSRLDPTYKLLQAVGPEALLVESSQVCVPPSLPPIFCPASPPSLMFWTLWVTGFRCVVLFYSFSMLFLRSIRYPRSWKKIFCTSKLIVGKSFGFTTEGPLAGRDWGRICPECCGKMTLLILRLKTASKMHIEKRSCVESEERMFPHYKWGLHRAFLKIKVNMGCTGISAVLAPFALKTNSFTFVLKPIGKHRAAGTALPFQPGVSQRWSRAWPRLSRVQGIND